MNKEKKIQKKIMQRKSIKKMNQKSCNNNHDID